MVGRRLSEMLIEKGYDVIWLSREKHVKAEIPRYKWNLLTGEIDKEALEEADVIVHLAGVGIAEGRWTEARKRMIVGSRVRSAHLLLDKLKELDTKIDAFISASAVGYYGASTTDKVFKEEFEDTKRSVERKIKPIYKAIETRTRKETAEKFAEYVKEAIVNMKWAREDTHIKLVTQEACLIAIDEICKEITGGEKEISNETV